MFNDTDANLSDDQYRKLLAMEGVEEIENAGMDEGRFFVHLKEGFRYNLFGEEERTRSFGGFYEARKALKIIFRA